MRTTNLIVAGKTVVVAGYGWCGKGTAMRAKGLGANVIVTEVDPVKALEAVMDGFRVMPMIDAAPLGDVFVTVTGCNDVITQEHFLKMKNGAICCNAGHFDVEVAVAKLAEMAVRSWTARQNIQAYELENGRTIYILAEGRLVNLASGDGHPAEIMDMSFAIQALSARWLLQNLRPCTCKDGDMLISVPEEIDRDVAMRELAAWGVSMDTLTPGQRRYLYGE
jgi:adenosylhomocysteinase